MVKEQNNFIIIMIVNDNNYNSKINLDIYSNSFTMWIA